MMNDDDSRLEPRAGLSHPDRPRAERGDGGRMDGGRSDLARGDAGHGNGLPGPRPETGDAAVGGSRPHDPAPRDPAPHYPGLRDPALPGTGRLTRETGGPVAAAPGQPGSAALVRLADFDPRHAGRILGELRGYWDGLRRGRAIPSRAEIEPRGLRTALGHAFILERIAPGAARFRLAGRHLIDLMGMEVRGMPLCSFFNPGSRGHLSDVLETIFAGPQIAELSLVSEGAYGRPALSARMLLLPLRSDLGDITRALGAVVAESEIGRPPRRFDLTGEVLTPVIDGARTLAPSPTAAGFAEPPNPPWAAPEIFAAAPARPAPPPPPGDGTVADRRARFRVIPGGQD